MFFLVCSGSCASWCVLSGRMGGAVRCAAGPGYAQWVCGVGACGERILLFLALCWVSPSVCPSGLRGYVQVVMFSNAWVQIPQLTYPFAGAHKRLLQRLQRTHELLVSWSCCRRVSPSATPSQPTAHRFQFQAYRGTTKGHM